MHKVSQEYIIQNVIGYITIANYITTFCLNLGWLGHSIRYLWFYISKHRICKRAPNLHPIYRDVQFLSRQRKLYNMKTHIIKYVLIVLYLCVDISTSVWLGVCILSFPYLHTKFFVKRNQIQSQYTNCHFNSHLAYLYFNPIYSIMYNVELLFILLQFSLLCILTRYLAARYLNHSFKSTLFRYLIWLAVQGIIIALCSTIYTRIFSLLLFPIFLIADWFVLLRDSRVLSRVLRSNLREIKLHSTNTFLYKEQFTAYKCYRIFHKFLLFSLFLCIAVITLYCFRQLFELLSESFCLLEYTYGFNYNPHLNISLLHYLKFKDHDRTINSVALAIYSFSNSLPLLCATLTPLIIACVKRYRSRHLVYRFNYENIRQPLLRGYQ